MRYEVHVAPPARRQISSLSPALAEATHREIERRLTRHPTRPNRWIRKLWDADGPQYCLRVGPARAFYDVSGNVVHVLAAATVRELGPQGLRPAPEPFTSTHRSVERVPLATAKKQLSEWMRRAREQPILITRHGRAAALLVGFETEEDWLEYRLRREPSFLAQVQVARRELWAP